MASVGIVMTKSLPFVSTNNAIRTFRHALSLDEVRSFSIVYFGGLVLSD